jgi:hypothetical protein
MSQKHVTLKLRAFVSSDYDIDHAVNRDIAGVSQAAFDGNNVIELYQVVIGYREPVVQRLRVDCAQNFSDLLQIITPS